MQNQFDFSYQADSLKAEGIQKVKRNADGWVQKARQKAIEHARIYGTVTSDDVHQICPMPKELHVNSMGAVFNTSELKLIRYEKSQREKSHSRVIGRYEVNYAS